MHRRRFIQDSLRGLTAASSGAFLGSRQNLIYASNRVGIRKSVAPKNPATKNMPNPIEARNDHLRLQYEVHNGTWRCLDVRGNELLSEACTLAYTSRGVVWSGDPSSTHKAYRSRGEKDTEDGHAIHTLVEFGAVGIRLEQEFLLMEDNSAVLLTNQLTNIGTRPLSLDQIVEVDALSGRLRGPEQTAILTNSFNSWDQSGLKMVEREQTVSSYYSVALREPPLVAGYLSGKEAMGTFEVYIKTWDRWGKLNFRSASRFDGAIVAPGETRSTDPLYIAFPRVPEEGLVQYASMVKEKNHVKIWSERFTTWCSWYAGYGRVAAADTKALETGTLANARLLVSEHLKDQGMDAVRIVDDGNNQVFGDWNFPDVPDGMGATAKRIRDLGIRAGVWLAPAFVSETSSIFYNHKDWLQRNSDGTLFVRKALYGHTMYFLDPSHPGALGHLRDLFARIRNWGYKYVMVDFMHMLVWGDKFHDSTLTKVQIYRRALQAIRQSLGSDVYLLGCGALMLPSVGLVDGMRITNDTWGKDVRSTEAMAARWFMHRNFWLNDPDAILTRDLSYERAQAWATLMAVTGGVQTLGDNLLTLDPGRLEIIKRIHPTLGESGRPLDVFDRVQSSAWDLPLKTSFGEWHLVALFNWAQEAPLRFNIDLTSLMNSPGPFLVYDFWNERFLGRPAKSLEFDVPFWSTYALSVRNTTGYPQLLSASNHISQGLVGLRDLRWGKTRNTLFGVSDTLTREPFVLTFYVPQGFVPGDLDAQGGQCDLAKHSNEVWKLRVEPRGGIIQWAVHFKRD